MEPELTSLGPAADTLDAADRRVMTPKPTEAWRDDTKSSSGGGITNPRNGNSTNGGNADASRTPRFRQFRRRQWRRRAAIALVVLQALWAVAVPLKNIGVTINPPTRPDQASLTAQTYSFNASSSGDEASAILGSELMPLIRQVARSTLGLQAARRELERAGSFDLDRVYSLLPLDDFAAVAQFYALEMQSAAFPAAAFTARPIPSASGSDTSSLVTLVLSDSTMTATSNVEIQLACSEDSALLPAMKCAQTANGEPCPEGAMVSNDDDDDQVANSTLYTFTDVDLRSTGVADGALSGLSNNVGLLFVVEFFSQAMSTLLAARDWESALQDLAFTQDADEALPVGSASAFTIASDNSSAAYLLSTDAFVVGVRAALMQSSLLDSCVASELTVALFYSRTLVLHVIREVLLEFELYNVRSGPSILLPSNSDSVLAPMWASSISITSGARASNVQRRDTRFFGSLMRAATREFADAAFKLDRSSMSSTQVSGSSLRMIQYLSFFPGLVSAFSHGTRQIQSADEATDYDFQSFALLGAAGAGVNTFQEAVAGAGSATIFPIAEIQDTDSSGSVNDTWWDDEARFASWFRALEADAASAPFGVFDSRLTIESVAPSIITDDDTDTRCHRALFKVLAKITYLSLVSASKPASYLMFMGDVDEGHRAWLLRSIDTEELFGETLFGAGDRVGLPFRNGKFMRKDDGSAWVIVPLLASMLDAFGKDEVLALLARELDDSFPAFAAGSSGGILHFPDARYCRVSGIGTATDGTTPLVVIASDSLDEVYAKISSGLEASLDALLDQIPALAASMYASVTTVSTSTPLISQQQIVGSSIVTTNTQLRGPPTLNWQFSPVTAGLRKLWPPRTPPSATVVEFRASTRCYRMLELRALTPTTRCLFEPSNTRVHYETLSSEPLRSFFLGLWSMSVLLNTLALAVVMKYLRKLNCAHEATNGFARLDLQVARQLGLQATGVLKISQSLLLLAASAPLVLAFHVPDDPVFMPELANIKPSKVAIDVLVTLSMSWVWKVGFEVANDWLQPWNWSAKWQASGDGSKKQPVWLVGAMYWQHDAIARLKWGALLIVLVGRLATRHGGDDSEYHVRKLAATVCSSLALGACSSAIVAFWRPKTSWWCVGGPNTGGGGNKGKVIDDPTASEHGEGAERDEQDAVIAALVQQKLPLHRYGVLGRTARGGWSKAALIMEGWRLARRASDGREVLRKGAGEIVLPGEPLLAGQHDGDDDADTDDECEVYSRSDVVPAAGLELETRPASALPAR